MSETKQVEIELFIAMNEEGDWIVETDESEALSNLAENQGGYHGRVVKLKVKMTPPKCAEIEVAVPEEAGETKELEVETA